MRKNRPHPLAHASLADPRNALEQASNRRKKRDSKAGFRRSPVHDLGNLPGIQAPGQDAHRGARTPGRKAADDRWRQPAHRSPVESYHRALRAKTRDKVAAYAGVSGHRGYAVSRSEPAGRILGGERAKRLRADRTASCPSTGRGDGAARAAFFALSIAPPAHGRAQCEDLQHRRRPRWRRPGDRARHPPRPASIYAAGYEYERDRTPGDPRRALMHRVLVLSSAGAVGTHDPARSGRPRWIKSGPAM